MRGYDGSETIYINCEIHGRGLEMQALWWGQYDHIVIFSTCTAGTIKLNALL